MAGGMDILVIGIGDQDNLDDIASDTRLNELFNRPPDDSTDKKLWQDQERLAENPGAEAPRSTFAMVGASRYCTIAKVRTFTGRCIQLLRRLDFRKI